MPCDWQPELYMAFGKERTQPSIDLAARIELDSPARVIDIGCGPGNSTQVLKARWPEAAVIGLDASEAMIAEAKARHPEISWIHADAAGDLSGLGSFDAVFSNAALQWIPNHEALLPKLFVLLNKGGVLAVQVPFGRDMPSHMELQKLAASGQWKDFFAEIPAASTVCAPEFYYGILNSLTVQFNLWTTDYYHIMHSHADIVKWFSGTGLRPYLDCLGEPAMRENFLLAYEKVLKNAYPAQPGGKILFPFKRLFFTAKKT